MDKPAYRSRPGTTLDGRQQTTLGRSGITTTARAALVREAATSGTRGDTGAITTAPWLGSYNSVHSAARTWLGGLYRNDLRSDTHSGAVLVIAVAWSRD